MTIAKFGELGDNSTAKRLGKCLYSVYSGSNDYINNYLMPDHYNSSSLYENSDQYADELIRQYTAQIKELYDTGARKFAVGGLSLIGCIPAELGMHNTSQCIPEINKAVEQFNNKLLAVVNDFNEKLPGAKFTLINFSAMQALTRLIFGAFTLYIFHFS
ncbi:hypothetical protein RDABS01_001677 [Bienertia sinuspersici]